MVKLKKSIKILRIIIDSELHFKKHITNTVTKELMAAIILRRLKMISSQTARQLFRAIVALVVDYTSSI